MLAKCVLAHANLNRARILVLSAVAVAQLVESRIVIPVVVGSSPIGHPKNSNKNASLHGLAFFFWTRITALQAGSEISAVCCKTPARKPCPNSHLTDELVMKVLQSTRRASAWRAQRLAREQALTKYALAHQQSGCR